jgi:hypothetical protein
MTLSLQPITLAEAQRFIRDHHRHHGAPVGWKFGVAINDGERVVGVITVGRPVARMLDNGLTLEVTRCCVIEGVSNGASMLYGAAWRAAKALGYQRLITYTLAEELGTSLTAAGWRALYETKPRNGGWSCPSRPRVDTHPLGQKTLWAAHDQRGG